MLGFFVAFGLVLHRPVPAARPRAVAAGGRPWTLPSLGGFIVGSHAGADARRRGRPSVMAAAWSSAPPASACSPRSPDLRPRRAGHRPSSCSLGLARGHHPGHRPDRRDRPAGAAGAASAISETSSELGGALGIAVLGSIGTAVYRGRWPRTSPASPARRPTSPATPSAAPDGRRAAPAQLGAALLETARAAFTGGLSGLATAAALTVGIAVLVATVLRRASAGDEPRRRPRRRRRGARRPGRAGRRSRGSGR